MLSIEEKEMLYYTERRILNVRNTLEVIKSELSNECGSLSRETIKGAVACVIESLDMISDDIREQKEA